MGVKVVMAVLVYCCIYHILPLACLLIALLDLRKIEINPLILQSGQDRVDFVLKYLSLC